MSHLTTSEILQITDGTIANGQRTTLVSHLDACPRCRQEVEFQRNLERVARNAPLETPSRDFTSRVIRQVAPHAKKSLVSKIVDSLGNIIAMGLVLTVIWYVVNTSGASGESRQPSMLGQVIKSYADYYSQARDFVAKEQVRLMGPPARERGSNSDNVLMLTALSLVLLVAVDGFVVRRVLKMRL
jgi:anti-sigma factor RsiW